MGPSPQGYRIAIASLYALSMVSLIVAGSFLLEVTQRPRLTFELVVVEGFDRDRWDIWSGALLFQMPDIPTPTERAAALRERVRVLEDKITNIEKSLAKYEQNLAKHEQEERDKERSRESALIAMFSSMLVNFGLVSTMLLAWRKDRRESRKDRRESRGADIDMEKQKLELERERLALEKLRMEMEQERAKQNT